MEVEEEQREAVDGVGEGQENQSWHPGFTGFRTQSQWGQHRINQVNEMSLNRQPNGHVY